MFYIYAIYCGYISIYVYISNMCVYIYICVSVYIYMCVCTKCIYVNKYILIKYWLFYYFIYFIDFY